MKNRMCVVWALFALLVALFVVTPMVDAAPVLKTQDRSGGAVSLTLLETQCSNAVVLKHLLGQVKPELLNKFKDARLLWEGKVWASCWIEIGGMVYSMDAEGVPLQPLPRSAFREGSV